MSVLNYLQNSAKSLVLSSLEKGRISSSINTLKARLNKWFGVEIIEQILFGSYIRDTILPRRADERSDIDYMIVFNNAKDYKPHTYIQQLKQFAEGVYSTSEIHQSHPTVVLILNHIKFDLVPAYKEKTYFSSETLYIAAPKSDFIDWTRTDPNGFNQELTTVNNNNYGLIKPMIRLIKYWNACNDYIFESYSMELELINRSYMFCSNLKDYLLRGINGFSSWNLSQSKKNRIRRAKEIVAQVIEYEQQNENVLAEIEIKKLIPEF